MAWSLLPSRATNATSGSDFHQADTIWGTTEEEALDGLRNLFLEDEDMDCSAIIEEEGEEGLTIQAVVKGQALADYLVKNPVGGEYKPLKTYFPDEEVSFIGEDITEAYDDCRMFFDGSANFKGMGIGAVLVSETGQHYPVSAKLMFPGTNKIVKYEACIMEFNLAIDMNIQELLELMKIFTKIEFKHVPRIQNEFAHALATLSSMIQHPDKNFNDPVPVRIHNKPAYCAHVEEETDGKPWFHDIKEYLTRGEYPEQANHTQKYTLRRLFNHFFQSERTLYRRTLDLGLLRCVDAKEASRLLEEIHARTCGPHMKGFVLAKKILKARYFWMTMETDCICDLMKAMCETFKIKHKNSTTYKPQMNRAMEAANKNIKKILRKLVENHKKWHEKLPFALLGYRTTVRTSTGATLYLLIYGTEAVIPANVEIPSLKIIQEAELSDAEWIRSHYEKLAGINGKRMNTVCHGKLYHNRMSRAFNKRVKQKQFAPGQLVLKKIFPHQDEAKGKFSPNWQGMVNITEALANIHIPKS
ncbi:uncharacterized protein [Nicotiana sylvestris]|uniref:uncharacterized protein n=1 Tax=Nicotiana sylvestris TaxID=4096 RepID=UPI00388CB189